jgi:hypothetical protein
MDRIDGSRPPVLFPDPDDVSLWSREHREMMLKAWESAKPKLVLGGKKFGKIVIYGTKGR